MSIKQSIAALLILFSVSFSAFGSYIKLTTNGNNSNMVTRCTGWMVGDVVLQGLYEEPYNVVDGTECRSIETVGSTLRVKGYSNGKSHWGYIYGDVINSCPSGQVFNSESGKCEEQTCEELKGKDSPAPASDFPYDDGKPITTTRYYCDTSNMCEAQRSYSASDGSLYRDFFYTGNDCVGSEEDYAENPYYRPVTDPTEPEDPTEPTDPTDPTHNPDDPTGDIFDPSPLPDSSNNTVTPDETEPEPEVEDPLTDPNVDPSATDSGVVKAITGMNSDINSALNNLNIDINQNGSDVQNQLVMLNDMVLQNSQTIQEQQKNDNRIYENTKALIQKANADITTSVNKNTNAVNALGDDLEVISGSIDGIADDVSGISETLDGIANTDTSGAGIGGTCIESGMCQGFYESGYPEGLGGLVSGQLNDLKTNTIDNFVNSFGELDLSNAQRPSFVLPVPFFGEFSFEEHISFDWVFGFIRAVLIMSSIFAARRIIFGG